MVRRSWRAGLVAAVLAGGLVAVPGTAAAAGAADPCGDVATSTSASPDRDLAGVRFDYSASSFQVRATLCASTNQLSPNGEWQVVVHLPGISPSFQLIGLMHDIGKYAEWTGFYACDRDPCPISSQITCPADGTGCEQTPGSTRPDGVRIENDDYWASRDLPTLSGRTAFGYGSWASVLPAGRQVPDTLEWWAEVVQAGTTSLQQVDRVPDSGTATATRNRTPVATRLAVRPGEPPVWSSAVDPVRYDTGTLTTVDGTPVRNRYVSVGPAPYGGLRSATNGGGEWRTSYRLRANTTVRAAFPGDGVFEPALSAQYVAGVRALVPLDLRDGSVLPRGRPVDLRGVVRPRGSGDVEVLVKPESPGYAWTLLRRATLVAGRSDTYYSVPWTPRTRGRYVLVTRWRHGTTAPGGVLNGQSGYRVVSVS